MRRIPVIDSADIFSERPKRELRPAHLRTGNNEPQRMAGSALEGAADNIIAELRGERDDGIIQNAMDDLYSLREIDKGINQQWDNARQLANITPEQLGNPQLVGNITENVPKAVVVNYPDTVLDGQPVVNQTRLHTRKHGNPVTGQPDVYPFIAQGESQPLITEFGVVGDGLASGATEGMHSDEFLGKRILQLMGMEPVANNSVKVTDVDLKDRRSGSKIDVEVLKEQNLKRDGAGMQVYTQVVPSKMAGTPVSSKQESRGVANDMAKVLRPLLKEKMIRHNLTIKEAVESLADEGLVSNYGGDKRPYGGKLLKQGGDYADKLVYPLLSNTDAYRNLGTTRYKGDTRKLVMPLKGAFGGDVGAAQDVLASLRGREAVQQMSVRPLPGNDDRTPAGKVYLQLPEGSRGLTDLSKVSAAVRQLLEKQ